MNNQLRISEIFHSIDGEVNLWGQGIPTVFVRLAGCHLRCPWCDAPESLEGTGHPFMTFEEIFERVEEAGRGCRKLTVTGGEPLLQRNVYDFFRAALRRDYVVTVETSGTIAVDEARCRDLRPALSFVFDYKLMYEDSMKLPPLGGLPCDWMKIVVGTPAEVDRAIEVLKVFRGSAMRKAISPVFSEQGQPVLGAEYLLDRLADAGLHDVAVNLQIHKWVSMR